MQYEDFIRSKTVVSTTTGLTVDMADIQPERFGDRHAFQPYVVKWLLSKGRAAIFSHYGTGKTTMIGAWAEQVAKHGRVLWLCPLAVAAQTIAEVAERLGLEITYVRSQAEVEAATTAIVITNYEMVDRLDCSQFIGVALDESAILRNHSGKVANGLKKAFRGTQYKLCASALPAPNNYIELLEHIDFLDVLPRRKVLTEYFLRDSMNAGRYQLKPFAQKQFWRMISSWAICLVTPSDLGYSDDGWVLPQHHQRYHTVYVDWGAGDEPEADRGGQLSLLRSTKLNATNTHKEQRLNIDRLAAKIAELTYLEPDEARVIWCFTDYESEAIAEAIPEAVELRGSESLKRKEEKLIGFSDGSIKWLITKPEIAGKGMNWQHAARQTFCMGTSYSLDDYDQAIHRLVRFGQQREVITDLVYASTAGSVRSAIAAKMQASELMQRELRLATRESQLALHFQSGWTEYSPQDVMVLPDWLLSTAA